MESKKLAWCTCATALIAIVAIFIKGKLTEMDIPYVFDTEWYDTIVESTRNLQLSFYPYDGSVQLYDPKLQKIFLKRMKVENINEGDLYVGNTIVILSRQHKLVGYANARTKDLVENQQQRTFAMIKPDALNKVGEIVNLIHSRNLDIVQMRMVHLTKDQAEQFYQEHQSQPFFEPLIDYITSGPVIAMELLAANGIEGWRNVLGPTDSALARKEAPDSLRAKFGKDKQMNAAHGSDSKISAQRELEFFFPGGLSVNSPNVPKAIAAFENTTLCIVKPHAVKAGKLGEILLAIIDEGFQVTGLKMARLSRLQAEEFLEVYRGVVNEYPEMIRHFMSGPLVALEIQSNFDKDTPVRFREFVGPSDPAVARDLRPHSLRSRFGVSKVENAVHCSDLPEDGALEVEYFFKILEW